MSPKDLKITDFTYDLPEERIAKRPLEKRESSQLAVVTPEGFATKHYSDLPTVLSAETTLVFNNTKVIHARLLFPRGEGIRPFEVFCLEPSSGLDIQRAMATKNTIEYTCLIGGAKRWKNNPQQLVLGTKAGTLVLNAHKGDAEAGSFTVTFDWNLDLTFAEVLEILGKTPLPPYLNRDVEEADAERYQTVFATYEGSVAAPTAGLHFSEQLMNDLNASGIGKEYVTLHVGAGTFKPVSSETLEEHPMHFEEIHVNRDTLSSLQSKLGNLTAVGTTSARTLESLYWLGCLVNGQGPEEMPEIPQWLPYEKREDISAESALQNLLDWMDYKEVNSFYTKTQLLIAPSYTYRMINQLITNFHQPQSTLILLVAAALGDRWKDLYQYALDNNYRFLSYGDGCLLPIPNHPISNNNSQYA